MAKILKPGESGSLSTIDTTQAGFRSQIAAVATSLRQVFGNGDASAEDATQVLLSSRYSLFVDNTIGRDDYEGGYENSLTNPPLLKQQLVCGYTAQAPFKTIQRAFIEAARISVISGADNDDYDRVVLHVAAGEHIIDNSPAGVAQVKAWGSSLKPTDEDLLAFNGNLRPGIILPRGVSIIGEDLRKTVIRPMYVPAAGGSSSTGRGGIFRTTGGSFFFNFTFKDAIATERSHHLLHCFEFCSEAELTAYYGKIATAFGVSTPEVRPGETEIAAPYPDGVPTNLTDSTVGSSCYVFNCSLRSNYGMCGIFLDGSQAKGFKSMVTAQFTNVSLQRDMAAWEIWSGGKWSIPASYDDYINADINNLRTRVGGNYSPETGCFDIDYRHFAFKCIRDAVIQEVSCFVIGNSVHHWTASGGECTITNSNSNFGQTALMSSGFRGIGSAKGAFPQDKGFLCRAVKRPLQIKQDGTNIRQLNLGLIASYDPATGRIVLDDPVDVTSLESNRYSLKEDDYLWVENRSRETGPGAIAGDIPNSLAVNARGQLAAVPWVKDRPEEIKVKVNSANNIGTISPAEVIGNRVFIRRLVDNRSPEEREYSLIASNSNIAATRRPVGNYVVRLGGRTTVDGQLDPANGADEVFLVTEAAPTSIPSPTADTAYYKMIIRPGDEAQNYAAGTYYRVGTPVFQEGRVKRHKRNGLTVAYDGAVWENSYSMLPSARGVEFGRAGIAPAIVIDKDLSPAFDSDTLGVNLDTDADVLMQLRAATDFAAVSHLMMRIGYSTVALGAVGTTLAGTVMQPQANEDLRYWDPSDTANPAPAGKLTSREAWPLEFNRPSLIRAFGHAYEWVGQSNYTKAMPKYQLTTLSDQHKIDFFAVNHMGGRVYNTGFNEDGLLVQGDTIKDLSTNRTVNTETAGLGGLSGDPTFDSQNLFPTEFENLTVTKQFNASGQSNINNITISGRVNGTPTWEEGSLPVASQIARGIIEIATANEVKDFVSDSLAVTPATLIEALGDAVKSVVNLRLSLSATRPFPDANQASSNQIYVHPYGGNEIALFNTSLQRWQVIRFNGILPLSLAGCSSPETTYDVYLYNSGTANAPALAVDYAPWGSQMAPPIRTLKDGVFCKNGKPERRLVGVVHTTAAGTSVVDLGGTIAGGNSANYPRINIANLYNRYSASMRYFFGSQWNTPNTQQWAVPPASIYPTAPRCSWVQGAAFLATTFLDIYGNSMETTINTSTIAYVAPGIDSMTTPPADAFYGETQANNQTSGSQWARSLPGGKHDIYYLYRQLGGQNNLINEHPGHGMIVIVEV